LIEVKTLGIDYGLKRIGLALGVTGLAEPFLVVNNSPKIIAKIVNVCRDQAIKKIILGLPEGKLAVKVKAFGKKLALATGVPVIYQAETLTSKEAIVKMIEAGKKRKARRERKDAVAAAIILQNYLDERV
jgi:putative Holliday junction resolvase